jgi:hypothetical protein
MKNKELEGFAPHQIAKSINDDLTAVANSPEVKSFLEGLEYKSPKTKEKDLAVYNLLRTRLEIYARGWLSANTLATAELYRKNEELDNMEQNIKTMVRGINDELNRAIVTLKDKGAIDPETLADLRTLEINLKTRLQ